MLTNDNNDNNIQYLQSEQNFHWVSNVTIEHFIAQDLIYLSNIYNNNDNNSERKFKTHSKYLL
jgi:hypothetical protein